MVGRNNMKASIDIVSFNRKKMTKFCIDSLINSTKRDSFELIVVDNFSTDGTVEMLKEMKERNIIDKLILNPKNLHLGKASNQSWDVASKDTDWLVRCNNDFFFMDNWLDNLTLVVNDLNVDFVYCLNLESVVRSKVPNGTPKKTKNGGFYLEPTIRADKSGDIGAATAIKKSVVDKYNIRYDETPFRKGHTGPSTQFFKRLHELKLKSVRLDKPCLLLQFPEYDNPLYKEYYKNTFGIRGLGHVLDFKRKHAHVINPAEYYKGTNYLESYKRRNGE